jgi:hypothetical protein
VDAAVAAWALAWNRWRQRPWRSIDASAFAIMVAQIVGAVTHSASVTSVSRLGAIALFVVIGGAHCPRGAMRTLALITLALTVLHSSAASCSIRSACRASGFRSESEFRGRNTSYAILIPLLAFLIVRTLGNDRARGSR